MFFIIMNAIVSEFTKEEAYDDEQKRLENRSKKSGLNIRILQYSVIWV